MNPEMVLSGFVGGVAAYIVTKTISAARERRRRLSGEFMMKALYPRWREMLKHSQDVRQHPDWPSSP